MIKTPSEHNVSKESRQYSIDFILSLKDKWTIKPLDMNFVKIPLKIQESLKFNISKQENSLYQILNSILEELTKDNIFYILYKLKKNFTLDKVFIELACEIIIRKVLSSPKFIEIYLNFSYELCHYILKQNNLNYNRKKQKYIRKSFCSNIKHFLDQDYINRIQYVSLRNKFNWFNQKLFNDPALVGELYVRRFIKEPSIIHYLDGLLLKLSIENIESNLSKCYILLNKIWKRMEFFMNTKNNSKSEKEEIKGLINDKFEEYLKLIKIFSDSPSLNKQTVEKIVGFFDLIMNGKLNEKSFEALSSINYKMKQNLIFVPKTSRNSMKNEIPSWQDYLKKENTENLHYSALNNNNNNDTRSFFDRNHPSINQLDSIQDVIDKLSRCHNLQEEGKGLINFIANNFQRRNEILSLIMFASSISDQKPKKNQLREFIQQMIKELPISLKDLKDAAILCLKKLESEIFDSQLLREYSNNCIKDLSTYGFVDSKRAY